MQQLRAYPDIESAPGELGRLSGPCGPISVWLVLTHHGISASPREIVSACRYTDEFGSFAVCLAEALQCFGLRVRFHSEPDTEQKPLETESYASITALPPVSVSRLLRHVALGCSVILSYAAVGGEGHFSPLAGARANKLLLPYDIAGQMLKSEFAKRWRARGICRQAIVAA